MTTQPKTILANGQIIEGPDARHYISATTGQGTGFATAPVKQMLFLEHKAGKFDPVLMTVMSTSFWALDRRCPKRLCTMRPIANFWHN